MIKNHNLRQQVTLLLFLFVPQAGLKMSTSSQGKTPIIKIKSMEKTVFGKSIVRRFLYLYSKVS